MIFFVVCFAGIVFIEALITKRINIPGLIGYYAGFVLGFVVIDSYKYYQLGGTVEKYLEWWRKEWKNMLNQSSGIDLTYNIYEKINYLEEIFKGCNQYSCIIMLLAPVVIYIYHVLKSIFKQNDISKETLVMSIGGVGGTSLIIYFVLLGGAGLAYDRRHVVNEMFVKLFFIYILFIVTIRLRRYLYNKFFKGNWTLYIAFTLILIVFAVPIGIAKSNIEAYYDKTYEEPYNVQVMKNFLSEVDKLPADATLWCGGQWFEYNVELYLNREMRKYDNIIGTDYELGENDFFIVGFYMANRSISDIEEPYHIKLIQIDTSKVDYDKLKPWYDRRDFELFSIYKMKKKG